MSYCMVIDNKPQNMKYTHPVTLNNNVLPYTTKCKHLSHIINNNLTDDDDIARQKICFYDHASVLARRFLRDCLLDGLDILALWTVF